MTRAALFVAAALTLGATPALADSGGNGDGNGKTLVVAPRKATFGCAAKEQFNSINAAIAAANPGDTILVCPGTYQEQVVVNKPRLTLVSDSPQLATIKAPTTLNASGAIVQITAPGVKVLSFIITSSGTTGNNGPLLYGVQILNGGSGDLEGNDISNINDDPLSGVQRGIAVDVGDPAGTPPSSGAAVLRQNTIENYQKGGIVVHGPGSSAEIQGNVVSGVGPTTLIAQNGIQVSSGATALLAGNRVVNNVYSGDQPAQSVGILLINAGRLDVEANTSNTNDTGIYDALTTTPSGNPPTRVIDANRVAGNTFTGIALDGSMAPQVFANQAAGSWNPASSPFGPGDGYDLFDGTSRALLQNDLGAGDVGDGFHAFSDSPGNTFKNDQAPANLVFDCQDDTAGVANNWINDLGDVNSPPNICHSGGGNGDGGDGHSSHSAAINSAAAVAGGAPASAPPKPQPAQ